MGMHTIWNNSYLRVLAARSLTVYLSFGFFATLYILYALPRPPHQPLLASGPGWAA